MRDFFNSEESDFVPSFDFKRYSKPIKAHILRKIILRRIGKKELTIEVKAPLTAEIEI